MKTPEEHADNIAHWTNGGLRQAVIDEIRSSIAVARAEQREAIRSAAQPFIDFIDNIPERRPDHIGLISADKIIDGEVIAMHLTVGDFRKLAAAIRNGTGSTDEGETGE